MSVEVVMPVFGEIGEGTILSWKKKVGDPVQQGEVICEVEADKAMSAIESAANGVLERIVVQEGETVRAGTVIAIITDARSA